MRFLLIASYPDSIINFRGPLLDDLCFKKLEIHVAAPDLTPDSEVHSKLKAKDARVYDIPLRRTGMNPLSDLGTLLKLWRLMKSIRPDYVLAYTAKPVIYGMLAAWLAGVPHRFALVTGLGYAFQEKSGRGLLYSLVKRLYSLAMQRTHKVFFQNPDDEYTFRSLSILPTIVPSCVVNGSGVDIDTYELAPLPEKPSFLLIARLLGDKGVREYVAAARRVLKRHPEVNFNLVGWIDENPDSISQEELDTWVAEGTIRFYGKLVDVRLALADCSVYVLPSYHEGTPRTVLEAMAMGRAIITTDTPGCRQTVIDNENGFLVPVKSVDALEVAMQRFIDNSSLILRMGQRSREIAEEKYDVRKVNAAILLAMGIE